MSGCACAAAAIAAAPSCSGDDLVAVRGQGDPQGPDELRVVVGDEDLHASWTLSVARSGDGQRDDHREPAAGGVLGGERAAHALGEALRQREPEAEAGGVVGVAEALERREDVVAALGGDARRRGR